MFTYDICIGNYGYYNEGKLRDKWFTLPYDDIKELWKEIRLAGLKDDTHEEIYISDTDGDLYGMNIGENEDIELLNAAVKLIDNMTCDYTDAITAAVENNSCNSILEFCNIVMSAEEIPFYSYSTPYGNTPEEKFGYEYVENNPLLMSAFEENEELEWFFDYEECGRSMGMDYTLYDDGYYDCCQGVDTEGYSREDILEEIEC